MTGERYLSVNDLQIFDMSDFLFSAISNQSHGNGNSLMRERDIDSCLLKKLNLLSKLNIVMLLST